MIKLRKLFVFLSICLIIYLLFYVYSNFYKLYLLYTKITELFFVNDLEIPTTELTLIVANVLGWLSIPVIIFLLIRYIIKNYPRYR